MSVRAPVVAGTFYPASSAKLQSEIASLFGVRPTKRRIPAKGILAPHAGYIYSGAVAAQSYQSTEPASLYLILGPNHTGLGTRVSLWPDGAWRIPLGEVSIDTEAARSLLEGSQLLQADRLAHAREHCIEVQLPLIQSLGHPFKFVPMVLGHLSPEECAILGQELAAFVKSRKERTVIVASSDMSHYVPDSTARRLDKLAMDKMLEMDPEGLYETVEKYGITMCGYIPATVMITATLALGAKNCELIRYTTSAEASGDYDHVVGYAGMAFW